MTPEQAKLELRKAVRKALGLRKNGKVDITSRDQGGGAYYSVKVPSVQSVFNMLHFKLYYFPGCCKYGILSEVSATGTFRGKKLSYPLIDVAVAIARKEGYSKIIATTAKEENSVMEHVLERAGWKRVDKGKNANSGNVVTMWIKETGKTRGKDVFMSCDSGA